MASAISRAFFVFACAGSVFAIQELWKRARRRDTANVDRTGRVHEKPGDNSQPSTVIIIGSGAIGLSTAYQLAKDNRELLQRQNIVVIDVYASPFGATSQTNTGILGYSSFAPNLFPLGKYSFELWKQLAQDAEFAARCGFKPCSNISVSPGKGLGLQLLPNWIQIQKRSSWNAWRDPPDAEAAIMWVYKYIVQKLPSTNWLWAYRNPTALGPWLYEQCLAYDVQFYMRTKVVSAVLSHSNEISSIQVQYKDGKVGHLDCNKLILAAGPWTPSLFRTLFPDSTVDLQPTVDVGDWIVCHNAVEDPKPSDNIGAVFLDEIVGHKLEFAGRTDSTIFGCGERIFSADMPPAGEEAQPDEEAIQKLTDYAQQFLVGGGEKVSVAIVKSGRAFRPARKTALPIIAAVPSKKLCSSRWPRPQCDKESIYICSGHGSYGITLSIGSGKLMSQIVRGKHTDVDLSSMGVE
ncbi:hypothetical protein B7494_g5857 [Chlorociboria aeruginascens]|nr:hypothetical protein B7494_g5857 [Chlorociboria aeruginascens]